eukprot:TRINITY_DN1472_c0_g1_i5.p1 TRINITY_DN1472_c0_g1~~TRINITY_DN1472_c0_g1_i5.p1  ORF type:complete len:158 (+),score=22.42 TRINITY_DN1472_c0_g1_i5:42-476(+)
MQSMRSRMENQRRQQQAANRSSLFSGVGQGSPRNGMNGATGGGGAERRNLGASDGANDRALYHENAQNMFHEETDRQADLLHSKVSILKDITLTIDNEITNQNRMLDNMVGKTTKLARKTKTKPAHFFALRIRKRIFCRGLLEQ